MAKTRRGYAGASAATTLSGAVSSVATSITIAAATNWYSGANPFFVVLSPGTASEEKVSVTRSGTTLTVVARGVDGTSATNHADGAEVYPVFTAVDADEANELAATWTTKGDLVSHDASSFVRLGVGSDGQVLTADSAQTSGLGWSSSFAGNAATASALQTSRTISLTGDVTGSVGFDGSANVSISATVAADSVALGTDTTGNYVADVAGGTGVTVTHTPGEGSTPSVAIGQAVGTGDSPAFAGLTVNGDVQMNQVTPVLTINDTDATFGGTVGSYIDLEANGTRAGYMGFPNSTRLYVRTENGDMYLQADNGSVYVIPGASAIVAFDDTKVRIYDDGSASDPVLTWNSDQNTGIFRPGADTLGFSTAGSERVTIDSSGKVGVGVSSGLSHIVTSLGAPNTTGVGCFAGQATSAYVGLVVGADSTATRFAAKFFNPNGQVGSISTNGSATSYTTSSDYRLKENVTPVDNPIGRLQAIQVHDFNFISDPTVRVSGFIAHELAEVIPEAVIGEKDAVNEDGSIAPQGVDQSKVVPLLVAALQNALARIEALEAGN